ncbi:MAG TPA: spore coat U domain-containing protein [Allosphingosinicella sp.]|jgi:spore coat protein U-like protein
MKIILRAAASALALAALSASPAFAQDTATAELDVSATVTENCAVSTTAIDFGDVDVTTGAAKPGTGALRVTCTSGTEWIASADIGLGSGASLATRKLTSGGNAMSYNLYTDANHTNLWGDGVGEETALFSDTGNGAQQSKTIYGRIFANQASLPSGDYADTVTVTVSY